MVPAEALAAVLRGLGVRVTSVVRSVEENRRVGGSPSSLHLVGQAVDFEADTPAVIISLVGMMGTVERHEKGTGPHYHAVVTWASFLTGVGLMASLAGLALIYVKDREREDGT